MYILDIGMRSLPRLSRWVLPVLAGLCLTGCRGSQRRDFLVTSATNLSHTYRATIIIRQFYVEEKLDRSPTTYVLLDSGNGGRYEDGADFPEWQVVMKPSQCGPLSIRWTDEKTLTVICEKCGLSLAAVGAHADGIGDIRIHYEGFPAMSSWETTPRGK